MVASVKKQGSPLVTVGEVTSVYGIKGWVKIRSFTSPAENIFSYSPWLLKTQHGVKEVKIDEYRPQGKGVVAHIVGVDDRELAQTYCQLEIAVSREQFPDLDADEFYWHELIGLKVVTTFGGSEQQLGTLVRLLETGANDVLVVNGDPADGDIDAKERLIPYVPEQFVLSVDVESKKMVVDWDPDF